MEEGVTLDVMAEVTDVACAGELNGQIIAVMMTGEAPYEFVLDGPEVIINSTACLAVCRQVTTCCSLRTLKAVQDV